MPLCFVISGKTEGRRVRCLLPSQRHGRLAGMLFSHCNWDVSEAPVWHVALRDRPRAHGEKRAKYCLSAWDKMTWVNSINTMTNIPPNTHTSPQLPLCPCTRTHSLWEPVAGKLIGSICCLGGSIPSSNPLHPPPGHLETPAWLWAPKVMGVGWGRERERGRDTESKLAAGALASGDVVRQAGKLCQAGTPPRDRWFTDLDRMQGEKEMWSWQMQKITCFKD